MLKLDFLKNIKMDRNSILVGIAVLGIVITGGLIYFNSNHGISFNFPTIFGASDNKIGLAAVDYINKNGLGDGDNNYNEEIGFR